MFGVLRFWLPLRLRSPHPWSSVRITTMFGRLVCCFSARTTESRFAKGDSAKAGSSKVRIFMSAFRNWFKVRG